jgi:hypothetical protein
VRNGPVSELRLAAGKKVSPKPEPEFDFMVRVQRKSGCIKPSEYDLSKEVELFYPHQKRESVKIKVIYEYMRDLGMLDNCLIMQDGLAIQEKGIGVFRKLYGENHIFLPDLVEEQHHIGIRYLYGTKDIFRDDGEVKMGFLSLDNFWKENYPILCFNTT